MTTKPFVGYTETNREQFMADIECIFNQHDALLIRDAYQLAKYGHRMQTREGGQRYFEHPREVARICYAEFGVRDKAIIIAALLHDIIEDTFILSMEALERLFGRRVASIVRVLSKIPKEGYHQRLINFGSVEDWIVKLGDNLNNIRTLDACPIEKRIRKIAETRQYYYPLIKLLRERLPKSKKVLADRIQSLFDEAIAYIESL